MRVGDSGRLFHTTTFGKLDAEGNINGDHKNVPAGTNVEVVAIDCGRYLVTHEGRHAYVSASFLHEVQV
jgi:hypothetical protein